MKKIVLIFMSHWFMTQVFGQNIIQAEYFFNTEPGVGNGTPIAVASPGDSVEFTFTAPTFGLPTGFNSLFVRFKTSNQQWGMTMSQILYVVSNSSITNVTHQIEAAEYFIDIEPGVGNGIPLVLNSPADSVEQNFSIPVGSLSTGFHFLHIRTKGDNGKWSMLDSRSFYIEPIPPNPNIIGGEFFVDIDSGVGTGTPFTISSIADSIEQNFVFDLPALSLGPHQIYIRYLTDNGKWSMVDVRPIVVCESYGAVSQFSYTKNNGLVAFENESLLADSVLWNFGDNTTSSLSNPIHQYSNAGIYNVQLTSYNNCANGNTNQSITIAGLESVSPGLVSNASISTLTITGFAFDEATEVSLLRSGQSDLLPLNTTLINSNSLSCPFNFIGSLEGLWDLQVVVPLEGTFTLTSAIEITSETVSNEFVRMETGYPSAIRTGRKIPAPIGIVNDNFSDVLGVPVFFRDKSYVTQTIASEQAQITSIPFFMETYQYLLDNGIGNTIMEFHMSDPLTNSNIGGVIIPKVAGHDRNITSLFTRSSSLGVRQHGALFVYPQLDAVSLLGTPEYTNSFCLSSFVKHAVESVYVVSISDADWDPCFNAWNDSLWTTISALALNGSDFSKPVSIPACLMAVISHMAQDGCVSQLPTNLSNADALEIVRNTMVNICYLNEPDVVSVACPILQGLTGNDHEENFANEQGNRTNEFCDEVASFGGIGLMTSVAAAKGMCAGDYASLDPNTKYGLGDNDTHVFVNPSQEAYYNIQFENDSTAAAPAEFVIVTDTLNADKFDLSTFRWGTVSLSDSIFLVPNATERHQVILTDLRPALPYYLLSHLDFDESTAIIQWNFATLDTLNLQPLELEVGGFLPPNIGDNEGTGDVNFYVQFSPNLVTGDSIQNKASIVFDFNEPIITPYWNNVVDLNAPASAVNTLPATTTNTTFEVTWSGIDAPAGISTYSIYVSENNGPFVPWLLFTDLTSTNFIGTVGSTYKFYSVAVDRAGNWEMQPEQPLDNYDALIEIITDIHVSEINDEISLSTYPVPAHDIVNMKFVIPSTSLVKFTVSDITGKNICLAKNLGLRSGKVSDSIDTSELSPGVYVLTLFINDQSYSTRLIIQ